MPFKMEDDGALHWEEPKVLYVAGPMTGIEGFNYAAFFVAEAKLKAAGYRVLNPARNEELNPTPGTWQKREWYMKKALPMLLNSDGVALLSGWQDSAGARLETYVAQAIGIEIQNVETWIALEANDDLAA